MKTIIVLILLLIISVGVIGWNKPTEAEIVQDKYVQCRIKATENYKGNDLRDMLDICFETYKLDSISR